MITKSNLKDVLRVLQFVETFTDQYEKQYEIFDCSITIDLKKEKITYPEDKGMRIDRHTTDNFSANENFVVLECVDRLLSKGYRPEHIELEKKWTLGHMSSGGEDSGFADICVYGDDGKILFIIECKTAGREYTKEHNNTINYGGQLFSYWQQERSCKFLVLYAADFAVDKIVYTTDSVDCSDDLNILALAKKDDSILLYKDAHTVEELYNVWDETYEKRFCGDVIFRDDFVAYNIGVKPLRKSDLKDFSENDKIVNKFEEILRHNNVSDKESAFNRLIALFICKLVDEIQKGGNDEVDFQYRVGTDTYESLQDRLQRLHKEGMEKFMREEIFYVPDTYAEELVQQYSGHKRKNMINDLKKTLRILKFYTNNDFAFKDVHNEELFYQNGKIVVEVVQLFERYRIIGSSDVQMLGDLFEQLLNKGFKQNEGQFFTPIPITRFIWDSLPVTDVINKDHGVEYPKIIDYACGAGHFLTQGVEAVNASVKKIDVSARVDRSWVENKVYGIEKDYRLARVSKISLFMHGAGNANIVFGDGLENYSDKGIAPESFDILVANPPYAVKAFKSHLKLKYNDFNLLNRITNDSSEIETLFVERISQLMKPNGLVAVILPSSILSNDSSSYTGAREELLQHFNIRAIACFGSKTFGATGTNTVILFLQKIDEPPVRFKLVEDSADAILSGKNLVNWEDEEIYDIYLSQIECDKEFYDALIKESQPYRYFADDEYLKNYISAFEDLADVKNKLRQKGFQKLSEKEQRDWLNSRFYSFVKEKEKEKLMYFAMVYKQTVLIVTAPADNAKQKQFLGYDWSNRKGNEGIVLNSPGGMLYNDSDRFADDTLSGMIRNTFSGKEISLPRYEEYYRYENLKDMLDFTKVEFNKVIKTMVSKKVEIASKYPVLPLGNIVDVRIGGTPSRSNIAYFTGKNLWVSISEMNGQIITDTKEKITDEAVKNSNVKLIPKGTTLLSFKLSIGKTAVAGADLYTNEAIAALVPISNNVTNEYLFVLFSGHLIDFQNVGDKAFGKSLNSTYLKTEIKIPVPPLDIQHKIVDECAKIDEEYNTIRMAIEEYRAKIKKLFADLEIIGGKTVRLDSLVLFNPSKTEIKNISDDTIVSFVEMASVSNNGFIEVKENRPLGTLRKGSYTYFAENDIIIAKITPCMENGKCALAVDLASGIGIGSSEFHVIRCRENAVNKFIFGYLNRESVRKLAQLRMTGSSGHRRVPVEFYEEMQIPAKSVEEQEAICQIADKYEEEIEKLTAKLTNINAEKQAVLKKYL